jgi:hypothetical protein
MCFSLNKSNFMQNGRGPQAHKSLTPAKDPGFHNFSIINLTEKARDRYGLSKPLGIKVWQMLKRQRNSVEAIGKTITSARFEHQ